MQQLISTQSQAPADRLAYWMDFVCAQLMRLDCVALTESRHHPFVGEMGSRQIRGLTLARMQVQVGGAEIRRKPAHLTEGGGEQYMVILQDSGRCRVRQDGREGLLRPGDSVLAAASRPYQLSFEGDFAQTVLVLPGEMLAPFARDLERGCASRLDRELPATQLLARLASVAAALPEPLPAHLAAGVGHLIAETLIAALPGSERRGLAGYHLASAKEFAVARLADPELSVAMIATHTGVSSAHLHRLFAARHESVMAWVWARRLEACRRDLEDELCDAAPVASIGFRWGFKTGAHFSRAFRDRYGMAPGEWRRRRDSKSS